MSGQIDTLAIVLTWCAAHHATISYGRDGTVTVRVGKVEVRGGTLIEAWRDAVSAWAAGVLLRQAKKSKAERAANHTPSSDGGNGTL